MSYNITYTDDCSTRLHTWWVLSHFTMNNKINDFMKTLAVNDICLRIISSDFCEQIHRTATVARQEYNTTRPTSTDALHSHHLSLPRPFTPDCKHISFTNPFLHRLLIPSKQPSRILNLYWTKWALVFVCFSFFFFIFFLVTCARLCWSHSAFESSLNSSIVSYCRWLEFLVHH